MPRFAIPLALVAALVLSGGLAMVVIEPSDDDPVASAGDTEGAPDEAGPDAPVEPQDDPAEPQDDPAEPQDDPAEPEVDAGEADDDPVRAQSDGLAGGDPDQGSEDVGSAEHGDGESTPADGTAQTVDPDDDRDVMALPETGADGPLLLLGATVVAAAGTSRRSH